MWSFDLFEFFRYMLTVVAGTYGLIRLLQFIWHWQGIDGEGRSGSALLYRYAMVLLLRARFRRFLYDLAVIGTLGGLLVLLIQRHW